MRTLLATTITTVLAGLPSVATLAGPMSLSLDFNSGFDDDGNSQGDLVFRGANGFEVVLTDDGSSGQGGQADGVHITNKDWGNIKVGTQDYVIGAYNEWYDGNNNWHDSGIVARFNQGVHRVSLFDSDNDDIWKNKRIYAFDEQGGLIGQTAPGYQSTFSIDTGTTGGKLIYSIEFDTLPGTGGGASDWVYFTIDDLFVEYGDFHPVPEPTTLALFAIGAGAAGLSARRKRRRKTDAA